jgi:hypothetical protein
MNKVSKDAYMKGLSGHSALLGSSIVIVELVRVIIILLLSILNAVGAD